MASKYLGAISFAKAEINERTERVDLTLGEEDGDFSDGTTVSLRSADAYSLGTDLIRAAMKASGCGEVVSITTIVDTGEGAEEFDEENTAEYLRDGLS